MAVSMAELTATITADTSGFDAAMASAGQSVDAFGQKGSAASSSWVASSVAMGAASAALSAGLAGAVGAAGNFEASMNQVGAVTGATGEQLSALGALAMQIGQETAFSAQEGAAAITELGKAGIPIPDIMNGAAMATASLAAAGSVDMARAAEVMSAAMNTFQLGGDQAVAVADTLAAGANTSASSVDDLANGLANAGPAAQALGVDMAGTVAALALLSDRGLSGAEAGTQLRGVLNALTPSTKAAREEFVNLGLSTDGVNNAFFDAQGQFVGLDQASVLLYDSMKNLSDEQRAAAESTIFGTYAAGAAESMFQAQKAAVEGTGQSYAGYEAAVQASGQASAVAQANMAGMNGAIEQLRGSVETAAISLGTALTPAITAIATGLTTLVNAFLQLPAPIQTVIAAAAALAAGLLAIGAAIAPVVAAWGAFSTAVAPIAGLLAGITGGAGASAAAIALLSNPITLVIAALVALYAAYQTNFLGFADGVNAGVAIIQAAFQTIADFITGSVIPALENLLSSGQQIATALASAWSSLEGTATAAWQAIQTAIETALSTIQTAVETAMSAVQTTIETAWSTITTAVETALTTIQSTAETAWSAIQTAVESAMTTIQRTVESAWQAIQSAVETVLSALQSTVESTLSTISEIITSKAEEAKTGLVDTFTAMQEEAVAAVTALKDQVLAVFADAGSWLVEAGRAVVQGLIDGIGGMAGQLADAVGGMAGSVQDGVTGALKMGSPSLVMFQLGYDTGMGFALGIEAALPAVEDATASLAAAAPDATAEGAATGKHTIEGEVTYENGHLSGEVRANGHTARGDLYVEKVEVRDDRHLQRWAKDTQRRNDRVRAREK